MTTFVLNGKSVTISSDPETPLLWVVCDELGLMGAKFGCGAAQCGACTMYMAGEPIRACVTPVSSAAGQEITTPEGLTGKEADAVRACCAEISSGNGRRTPKAQALLGACQSDLIAKSTGLRSGPRAGNWIRP